MNRSTFVLLILSMIKAGEYDDAMGMLNDIPSILEQLFQSFMRGDIDVHEYLYMIG